MSNLQLVGGFNPFEKYLSKWKPSPGRDENNKYLKPPPSCDLTTFRAHHKYRHPFWDGNRIESIQKRLPRLFGKVRTTGIKSLGGFFRRHVGVWKWTMFS